MQSCLGKKGFAEPLNVFKTQPTYYDLYPVCICVCVTTSWWWHIGFLIDTYCHTSTTKQSNHELVKQWGIALSVDWARTRCPSCVLGHTHPVARGRKNATGMKYIRKTVKLQCLSAKCSKLANWPYQSFYVRNPILAWILYHTQQRVVYNYARKVSGSAVSRCHPRKCFSLILK